MTPVCASTTCRYIESPAGWTSRSQPRRLPFDVAKTVSAAVSPVTNSVDCRASFFFVAPSGTTAAPASRRVWASACSAEIAGEAAAPESVASGEPTRLISRPSAVTLAFSPLPKTGMPFTTCRHQMWRLPFGETVSRVCWSDETSMRKTSGCART